MPSSLRLRWVAVIVFVFSAALNYLDRQILATMVDIWRTAIHPGFRFDYADYGLLLSVFSIAYALSAPFMGWFLDRVGLNAGMSLAVAVWAVASFGTGTVHSFGELRPWTKPGERSDDRCRTDDSTDAAVVHAAVVF